MSAKTQQALELVKTHKHKKALAILKKINQKKSNQSFLSLHLEGVCLAQMKHYPLAEMTLNKALLLASKSDEEVDVLTNLSKIAIVQKKQQQAYKIIKKLFILDTPQKASLHLKNICSLSFDANNFSTTIEYADKLSLSTNEEDQAFSLVYLLLSSAALRDKKKLEKYFELLTQCLNYLEKELILFTVNNLKRLEHIEYILPILKIISPKFEHQLWYRNAIEEYSNSTHKKNDTTKDNLNDVPSEIVISDNLEIKKIIEKLLDQLKLMGAKFHKDLRFIEKNEELSIHSYASQDKAALLMQVPVKCMPLIHDFKFSLSGDELLVKAHKNLDNPTAEPIMMLMVELYNKTHKISHWVNTYPLLVFQDYPAVIDRLFHFRPMGEKLTQYKERFDEKNTNELLISSFLGAREFIYKKELLVNAGIKTQHNSDKGLLSIIDFLNHKMGDSFYLTDKKQGLVAISAKPDEKTKEVFVQYSVMDPILTYLTYGFVDEASPILFSGCLSFETLTKLKFQIVSVSAVLESKVSDPQNAHLEYFLPAGIERKENDIYISDIIIPNKSAENTLTQVLSIILKKIDKEGFYQNDEYLQKEINHLKQQIIFGNYNFWQQYKDWLNEYLPENKIGLDAKTSLIMLCDNSLEHISDYAKSQNISISN
ncbi:hypothetical protein [Thalassotalea sp. SU-HH00458]|uniref:hypothetical protein n=1 Tax=Thalassotalea sp. SU-HH00458 TaxID=3127657 RepID=UPI0031082E20